MQLSLSKIIASDEERGAFVETENALGVGKQSLYSKELK